jgi:hypothetical protein
LRSFTGEIFATEKTFLKMGLGNLEKISGLDNVRQQLYHRLITVPGSIVHRPNYGVGAQNFQNVTLTIARQRELALRVQEQFSQDDRVVRVLGLSFSADEFQPEKFTIICRVELQGYGETELNFQPFEG